MPKNLNKDNGKNEWEKVEVFAGQRVKANGALEIENVGMLIKSKTIYSLCIAMDMDMY